MKKLPFAAIVIAAAATLCATACKQQSPNRSADTFATDSVAYDSTTTNGIKCTIAVDYPRGNDSLAEGSRQFIARELAAMYLPYYDSDDDACQGDYPKYSGSTADGKQLVAHYGNGTMRFLIESRKELLEAGLEEHDMPELSCLVRIKVEEIKPSYITYRVSDESYLGGAHRAYSSYCTNISRTTFRPADDLIDPGKLRAMQPVLRKNVLQCVKACGVENVTDATLGNYIILPDDGIVPLPAHKPWLQGDSLKFVYQPYEIASYAMGTISFSIAAKDALPYLGKEAAGMIKQ